MSKHQFFNNNTLATHVLLLFLYSPQNIFMIILLLFNDIFDINEGFLLIPTSVCCFRIEKRKKIDDNNNIKRFSLTKHFDDLKVDFCQQNAEVFPTHKKQWRTKILHNYALQTI